MPDNVEDNEGWVEIDLGGEQADLKKIEETPPDGEKDKVTPPDTETKSPDEQKPDAGKDDTRFQKRINQLTRAREEANERAARAEAEAVELRKRLEAQGRNSVERETAALTTYQQGVEAKLEAAKQRFEDAYDAGDKKALVAAQTEMNNLQFEINAIKLAPKPEAPKAPVAKKPDAQDATPDLPEATKNWVNNNPWFGTAAGKDVRATQLTIAISDELIKEGLDPRTEDFYEEVEKRLLEELPRAAKLLKVETETRNPPIPPVSGQSRKPGSSSNKVVLTAQDQADAKRMGVSLEEFAYQKRRIEETQRDNPEGYTFIKVGAGRKK